MKKRITVLANTKRKGDGVCVAGIDEHGSWIRPIRVNGSYLIKEDLFVNNEVIIDTFYEVDFELDRYVPNPPNTEDYKISENKRPKLIRKISCNKERYEFLEKYADDNVESIFNNGNRSLGLVKCKDVGEVKMGWDNFGKFYSNISFTDSSGAVYELTTTDLRWAAFGKLYMGKEGLRNIQLNAEDIKQIIDYDNLFFSLGLARDTGILMKELIIGVFTVPDYAKCKSFWDIQKNSNCSA